jgi:hypothetical protein
MADHRTPAPDPSGGDSGGSSGGGIMGFFNRGYNEYRDAGTPGDYIDPRNYGVFDQRGQLASQLGARTAPQAQNIGRAGNHAAQQGQLMSLLMSRARGQGPSIADMQMQRGLDAGMAQQQSLAATGRGNAALASRQASQNASGMAQNMAGQGAMARLAEMQGAQQLAAGALQGARGQDLQRLLAEQQGNQFNVNAQLQGRQLNDQAQLGLLQQQLAAMGQAQGGLENYQNARTQRFMGLTQTPTPGEQLLGALSSAGAMFGG